MVSWVGQQWQIADATPTDITLACEGSDPFLLARSAFEALVQEGKIVLPRPDVPSNFTREGQEWLDQARDVDLATAVFRNRIIYPDQYHDDEQAQIAECAAAIPVRTKRYWRQLYREAESRYGSGFIGLLPQFAHCGRIREAEFPPQQPPPQVFRTPSTTAPPQPN